MESAKGGCLRKLAADAGRHAYGRVTGVAVNDQIQQVLGRVPVAQTSTICVATSGSMTNSTGLIFKKEDRRKLLFRIYKGTCKMRNNGDCVRSTWWNRWKLGIAWRWTMLTGIAKIICSMQS